MRIIFFGPPGAGKGTQAKLLSSFLKIPHLSTGEILRNKLKESDDLSRKLKNVMLLGKLVSDEILNEIIFQKLLNKDSDEGFILDGYPRTINQLEYFNLFINENQIGINKIINIELDDKTIENRILFRSRIEKRDDDNFQVIKTRIKTYNDETQPVVNFYKEKFSSIFFELNGDQSIEKIQSEVIKIAKNANF